MEINFLVGGKVSVLDSTGNFFPIHSEQGVPYFYTYTNLIINAADNSGNWLLPDRVFVDADGNTWYFVKQSSTVLRVRATNSLGNNIFNSTYNGIYATNQANFIYLTIAGYDSDNDTYRININIARPMIYRMSTNDLINANYFNGDAYGASYADDIQLTKRYRLHCTNFIKSGDNISITGVFTVFNAALDAAESSIIYFAGSSLHSMTISGKNIEFPPTDPYTQGGETGTGGGTGDFDGTGDDIDIPSLPTLSAVDNGFITLFNPSISELRSLASYMWSNPLFDLDAWKKIFADPMQAILGLSIVPVNVPSGGTQAVTVGNISTGVSMTVASSQYVELDCGTLNVNEFWGAYLDYDPYTKAEIYLPYIGTHALAVDDIMNKAVHVVYHVDVLSGACCAYVKCGGSVLYSFIGQCASSIPITGDNWTNVINGAISIAGAIGSMVATGGASAPITTGIAATAINQMKPSVEKSGSMSGTGGMMAVQTPYLILTRPRQALPASQNAYTGYPSFINESLGGLSGYTEVEFIHLENVPATENELSEIENLLKSGVIF